MFNEALAVGYFQFSNGVEIMVIPMYKRPNKFQLLIAEYLLGITWIEYN